MKKQVYTLLLKLEGPMQSWGYRSRFDQRDTALEPTRSGVIGLICAAMGIAREEDISQFESIRMGVRIDKKGRIERDYHTALNVIKADGSGSDTVVSARDYLADASFTVGLQSDDKSLLENIFYALCNPTWFLFLGRKAFPLSCPPVINPREKCLKEGALEETLLDGLSNKRIVLESSEGSRVQNDWPVCFHKRQFRPRHLRDCFDKERKRKNE
ncbi:type I-E CRISPR-associated protein Cas5/CasD [Aminobacterium mobile]|uniref:type I-E CRISPR-associated protein Cas5/CasD n=1 Tax=Aminobacterium mobile TaxID=81467 RepID=UPI003314EF02